MTEAARVYDLDGTLVRLGTDWRAAKESLLATVESAPVQVETEESTTWELFEVAERHGFLDAVEETVAEYEIEGARTATRLPHADELESLSVPAAVCSLNCEAACRIALDRHGLLDEVAVVIGRETVPFRKPHPEPLLTAVRAIGSSPAETLFVGDSESDERCAERAGTAFRYVDDSTIDR